MNELSDYKKTGNKIPVAERDSVPSCFDCIHFGVCVIRREFKELVQKFSELDATLDVHRMLAKNCSEFFEK